MQFSLEQIDRWRYARVAGHCTGAVLDIGCGRQILRTCLAPGATYLGVDLEEPGALRASALALPLRPLSFDTVVLCEVLEHLEAPGTALREAAAISRKRIVITVPNDHSLVRLARLALGRDVEIDQEHVATLNPVNIRLILDRVGFEVACHYAFPLRMQLLPALKCKSRFGYWHFVVAERRETRG
jgi:SAM-dependent methyltransferase